MIAVTGASGYLGGVIVQYLREQGHDVLELSRGGEGLPGQARYALGEAVDPDLLAGATAVVHAAWDFAPLGTTVRERNVAGSMPLLQAAQEVGARFILVSSLSAFEGCRSEYGNAKLELEGLVRQRGGASIRPGIVYGPACGGIFGSLVGAVRSHRIVPLLTGRRLQRLFLSDDASLCALVAHLCSAPAEAIPISPILGAYPVPMSLRQFVLAIGSALGRRTRLIPAPWQGVYLLLRAAEALGVNASFRSDSVLALANPIPLSQVAQLVPSPIAFQRAQLDAVIALDGVGGRAVSGGK